MNVLSQSGVSNYQNRTVTINVTGVCQQAVLKQGSYQVRVPYSQMTQAMQTIHRQGGQVASVQVGSNPPAQATSPAVEGNGAGEDASEDASDEDGNSKRSSKRKRR